jgi:hypothetical protein
MPHSEAAHDYFDERFTPVEQYYDELFEAGFHQDRDGLGPDQREDTLDTFVIKITLGNDAVQDAEDIAALLRNVAFRLENLNGDMRHGNVADANGNVVGEWEVS